MGQETRVLETKGVPAGAEKGSAGRLGRRLGEINKFELCHHGRQGCHMIRFLFQKGQGRSAGSQQKGAGDQGGQFNSSPQRGGPAQTQAGQLAWGEGGGPRAESTGRGGPRTGFCPGRLTCDR